MIGCGHGGINKCRPKDIIRCSLNRVFGCSLEGIIGCSLEGKGISDHDLESMIGCGRGGV